MSIVQTLHVLLHALPTASPSQLPHICADLRRTVDALPPSSSQTQEPSPQAYLSQTLQTLLDSPTPPPRLAAISALIALLHTDTEPLPTKLQRTANALRLLYNHPSLDLPSAQASATLLAELARLDNPMATRIAEDLLTHAVNHIAAPSPHNPVYAPDRARAAMVIAVMALLQRLPALVFKRQRKLRRDLWAIVWDPDLLVRREGVKALQAVLKFLVIRANTAVAGAAMRNTMDVLRQTLAPGLADEELADGGSPAAVAQVNTVHGSLVMMAALLREKETRRYMLAFSLELCSLALPYQSCRDALVRQSVANILPLVVQLDRVLFAEKFLDSVHASTLRLIRDVKFPAVERGRSLISLSVIAEQMPEEVDLTPLLFDLLQECRKVLGKSDPAQRAAGIPEKHVITTISHLASAARGSPILERELRAGLLYEMFRAHFTNEQVTALDNVAHAVPVFAETIRARLVHLIAGTLKPGLPNRKYVVSADQHMRTEQVRGKERRNIASGGSASSLRSFVSLGASNGLDSSNGQDANPSEGKTFLHEDADEEKLTQSGARNFFRQVPISTELHGIDNCGVSSLQADPSSSFVSEWVEEISEWSSKAYHKPDISTQLVGSGDVLSGDRDNSPCVALKAIINYEFAGLDVKDLCSLTNEFVIGYIEYNMVKVRALAVEASAKLMLSAATVASGSVRHTLIPEVYSTLAQFLSVAVADPSTDVRYVAIRDLNHPPFYPYLQQPEMLAILVLSFHDGSLAMRDSALTLACHLSHDNPAHVLPPLRRYLRYLMRVLRCDGSFFAKDRGEATEIVYSLVRNSSELILPYTSALVHALLARLQEAQRNNDTVSALPVLLTIAEMGGTMNKIDLRPYHSELVPLLVSSVVEAQGAETVYRKAALRALTAVVQNTGFVIKPYTMHPLLLPKLLQLLQSENDSSVRILAEILLGTLGAINPGENKYAGLLDYYGGSQSLGEKTPGSGSRGKSVVKIGSSGVNIAAFWGPPTLRFVRNGRLQEQQGPGSGSYESKKPVRASGNVSKDGPLHKDKKREDHLSNHSRNAGHEQKGVRNDDTADFSLSLFAQGGAELSEKLSGYLPCWAKEYISSDSLVAALDHPFTASPHYFPSAALDNLHHIIANPKLHLQHREACQAIVNILRIVGEKHPDFYAAVVPRMLILIVQSGPKDISYPGSFTQSQQHVVQRLADIVDTAGYYYRPFAFDTVLLVWTYLYMAKNSPACVTSVCNLLSNLCEAITDEFKPVVATILPPLLCALADDETSKGTITKAVLRTLESFGSKLEDYQEVVLTSLSKIVMTPRSHLVREDVLRTLIYLVKNLRSVPLLSGVLHPLLQVLAGTNDGIFAAGNVKQSADRRIQRLRSNFETVGIDKLAVLAAVALTEIGRRTKKEFRVFVPVVTKALRASGMKDQHYVVYLRLKTLLMLCDPDIVRDLLPEDSDKTQGKSKSQLNAMLSELSGLMHARDDGLWPTFVRNENNFGSTSPAGSLLSRLEQQSAIRVHVAEQTLLSKWDVTLNSRSEDWVNWMDALGTAMFAESGSPSLRACVRIAESYPLFAKELFNAVFLSCWTTELSRSVRAKIHESLDVALSSQTVPLTVLQAILNLYEFMDHDEKPLPGSILKLATAACRCGAFAKAVRYREQEYAGHLADPSQLKEDIYGEDGLISIYEKLGQVESAVGTINHYQGHTLDIVQEEWLEKLQRWDEALAVYQRSELPGKGPREDKRKWNHLLGRLRCLNELGEWPQMNSLIQVVRKSCEGNVEALRQLALEGKATSVAFDLGRWEEFEDWVSFIRPNSYDAWFYKTMVMVRRGKDDPSVLDGAENCLHEARSMLDLELTARVSEAYPRAYAHVVGAQVLVELEEMIAYLRTSRSGRDIYGKRRLRELWSERLKGCKQDRSTWYRLLMIRTLVTEPIETKDQWLEFVTMCRKSNRLPLACEGLRILLSSHPENDVGEVSEIGPQSEVPIPLSGLQDWTTSAILKIRDLNIKFASIKLIWATDKKVEAYSALQACRYEYWPEELLRSSAHCTPAVCALGGKDAKRSLAGEVFSKLSKWGDRILEGSAVPPIDPEYPLLYAEQATQIRPDWYKSWHYWGTMNASRFEALMEKETGNDKNKKAWHFAKDIKSLQHGQAGRKYLMNAITGFFRAIDLEGKSRLQDTLKLLTLWFNYGGHANLHVEFDKFFNVTNTTKWVEVVPQIIARLYSPSRNVQRGVISFLTRLGREHPQVAVYPLTVAKSAVGILQEERGAAATSILEVLRHDHREIVEQSELLAKELVRSAILWIELWYEKLEDAYKLFVENDLRGMFAIVLPLHEMIENGAETMYEEEFLKEFGKPLREAGEIWKQAHAELENGTSEDVVRKYVIAAWPMYHCQFRNMRQTMPYMSFDTEKISGFLHTARDLAVPVPGTYDPNSNAEMVKIHAFSPRFQVLRSKHRPRKFSMVGSDGQQYQFLLKGHEDLRQDERVMQVFGLINKLFVKGPHGQRNILKGVDIKRYAVIPLSENAGLIEWVPNCDTLHSLVKDYREVRKIMPNLEHQVMLNIAPGPDWLPLLEKVELFECMLLNTVSADVGKVMWLKSRNSEMWLERRNTYARSLATTSMTGYLLGLGDRHPSNLMIERNTGKVLHIDFGDCFEVAMKREQHPEKIPFRLTRMLVNALEPCGVHGYFRHTAEATMNVLREKDDRESLMAVMEAFVYDPLIRWKFLETQKLAQISKNEKATRKNTYGSARRSQGGPSDTSAFMVEDDPVMQSLQETGSLEASVRELERQEQMARAEDEGEAPAEAIAVVAAPTSTEGEKIFDPGEMKTPNQRARLAQQRAFLDADQTHPFLDNVANSKAQEALNRFEDKLCGTDFDSEVPLSVAEQVERLIQDAQKIEHLCTLFVGWCPFW